MITITRNIGKVVILFLNNTGNFFIFFTKVIQSLFKPWYFKNILSQMIFIGYFSLPVVSLTSFFSLLLDSFKVLKNLQFIEFPKFGLTEMKKIIKTISKLKCLNIMS